MNKNVKFISIFAVWHQATLDNGTSALLGELHMTWGERIKRQPKKSLRDNIKSKINGRSARLNPNGASRKAPDYSGSSVFTVEVHHHI